MIFSTEKHKTFLILRFLKNNIYFDADHEFVRDHKKQTHVITFSIA